MSLENEPKGVNRRRFLTMAAAAAGSLALVACGQAATGGDAAAGSTAAVEGGAAGGTTAASGVAFKWSTWGNPGEIQRFTEFTADYNTRTGGKVELVPLANDGYEAKMLTQLSGGTAPDVFYSGDSTVSKLISSNSIVDLTELLNGPMSKSKPDDFFDGLWSVAKTPEGKIYGVTVDCNPMVFWYNKKVLTDSGITTMPADLYKESKWSWDAFTEMTGQVVAAGKRGFIQENWVAAVLGWATTNGGALFDGENFVGNTDPKSVAGFQFIQDNLTNKNFTFSGSLPKGQGVDAMFLSQQAGFISAGRWLLPVFKKAAGLEYDIVAWPTNTGKQIEPAGIPTAYMVQNSKAVNVDASFEFLTDFVSKEGQVFRLKGGGNAVPSVEGADEVVSEGNLPPNWQALIDARAIGYAAPPALVATAGLSDDFFKALEPVWLKGGDMQATLDSIAEIIKTKKGQ